MGDDPLWDAQHAIQCLGFSSCSSWLLRTETLAGSIRISNRRVHFKEILGVSHGASRFLHLTSNSNADELGTSCSVV